MRLYILCVHIEVCDLNTAIVMSYIAAVQVVAMLL
jgi:hypothetical protein